eukprot:gene27848-36676_t
MSEKSNDDYKLIATSFDSLAEIAVKYPEAISLIDELNKFELSDALHSIDATNLGKCLSDKSTFDCIIFNFPHLGTENCFQHSSFLAHIFDSAKYIMKNSTSTLNIALSESQSIRWKLFEQAQRNNFELVERIPITEKSWPGYEMKRHQNGKSFKTKVENCFHFCFRLYNNEVSYEFSSNILSVLHSKVSAASLSSSRSSIEGEKNQKILSSSKNSRKLKRNVYILTEGMYAPVSESSSGRGSDSWMCTCCDQIFKSEQGARTHCYQVHCLQAEGGQGQQSKLLRTSISPPTNLATGREGAEGAREFIDLVCVDCSRSFRDSPSLQQHRKAKHGAYPVLQPGWAMNKEVAVDPPPPPPPIAVEPNAPPQGSSLSSTSPLSIGCPVCGVLFSDAHELQMHMENGFRPVSVERLFKCPTCTRDFFDERALRQHCNFCLPDFVNENNDTLQDPSMTSIIQSN